VPDSPPPVRGGRPGDSGRIAELVLAISYPLLAHAAVLSRSATLTLASVTVLAVAMVLPGLRAGRPLAWLGAAGSVVGLFALARLDAAALVLYLPPVMINAYFAWLFGHTLTSGRTPLIERLVRRLHDPDERLDDDIPAYAARLTAAWTVLFSSLGLVNLALALLASPGGLLLAAGGQPSLTVPRETWSLFANLLNYLVVACFFLAEYAYRRRRFPEQPYAGLLDFLRRAGAVAPAVLASVRREPRHRESR
jgi:uncharacterized membrane protein